MNNVMINDFRGMIMAFLLLAAIILILKTISIDTIKRICRIYKWTDIRYREMILLSGCIISSTVALGCFDDAQRIATAGTGLSNWLEIGTIPCNSYHYVLMVAIYIMLPVNFGIFLYKMYHTERGLPDKDVMADMVLLSAVPLVIISFHYAGQGILFAIGLLGRHNLYGYQASIKAGLFIISMIFQAYNTYSLKRSFDFTRLEIKKQEKVPELIWEKQNCFNAKKSEQKNHVYCRKYREIIYKIKRFKK